MEKYQQPMINLYDSESNSDSDDSFLADVDENLSDDKAKKKKDVTPAIRRLQKYRTRQKRQNLRPEQMTSKHARLERRHNPLIELLSVKLEIMPSDEESEDDSFSDEVIESSGGAIEEDDTEGITEEDPPDSEFRSHTAAWNEEEEEDEADEDDDDEEEEEEEEDVMPSEATREKKLVSQKDKLTTNDVNKTYQTSSPVFATSTNRKSIWDEDDGKEENVELLLNDIPSNTHNTVGQGYPRQQEGSLPHFSIKDAFQDQIGPLVLGQDSNNNTVSVPACMNKFLREYQRDGIKFFYDHYRKKEGGILGDDMGFGKTIQVVCFLAALIGLTGTPADKNRRTEKRVFPDNQCSTPTALILAPSSVLYNWEREFTTWGRFKVGVCEGSKGKVQSVMKMYKNGLLDIVICGHDWARNNIEMFDNSGFSCVIVDECHRLKDPRSQLCQAFHKFNTLRRFGLTGTATQNRYGEFWCILNWAFPGKLGSLKDWSIFVTQPLQAAQKKNATSIELAIGRSRATALVSKLLPKFFLRRTKDLIKDQLPKKWDRVVFCPLTSEQRLAYSNLLQSETIQKILTAQDPCDCQRRDQDGMLYQRGKCCYTDWKDNLLQSITSLQKISNHLCLIYPDKEDLRNNYEKYHSDIKLISSAFPNDYESRKMGFKAEIDPNLCGKWKILRDLLEVWRKNQDKVLIFSRSTRILDALQHWFDQASYAYHRLDGRVSAVQRLALCDSFNNSEDSFIFLISTTAGGVGINLTSANQVVIFDPNWNPVYDLQAMDRSYRWGQTRDVNVYRLVAAGSVEELIYTRQIYKQQASNIAYTASHEKRYFEGVQDDRNQHGELFGIKNLFKFQNEDLLLKSSVEEFNIMDLKEIMPELPQKSDVNDLPDLIDNYSVLDEAGGIHEWAAMVQDDGTMMSSSESQKILSQKSPSQRGSSQKSPPKNFSETSPRNKKDGPSVDKLIENILTKNDVFTHYSSDIIGSSAGEKRESAVAIKENRHELKQTGVEFETSPAKRQKRMEFQPEVWPPPRKSRK